MHLIFCVLFSYRFEATVEESIEKEPNEAHVSVIQVEDEEEEVMLDTTFEGDELVVESTLKSNNGGRISTTPEPSGRISTTPEPQSATSVSPTTQDRQLLMTESSPSKLSPQSTEGEIEKQQLSLTIEGTTVEATDVDDLDSTSNLNQAETKALSVSNHWYYLQKNISNSSLLRS